MAGEYRTEEALGILPKQLARAIRNGLRIGLADRPMHGVTLRRDLAGDMADAYEKAGCPRYAEGLRSGAMVPLMPRGEGNRVWAPGELFLRS